LNVNYCRQLSHLFPTSSEEQTTSTLMDISGPTNNGNNLRVLHMKGCTNFTNEALYDVLRHCMNLQSLDISNCNQLSLYNDSNCQLLAKMCSLSIIHTIGTPSSLSLSLISTHELMSDGSESCKSYIDFLPPNIQTLSIEQISSATLVKLIEKYPSLKSLKIHLGFSLSELSLSFLGKLNKLESFHIDCSEITDSNLEQFIHSNKQLNTLSIPFSTEITGKAISLIGKNLKDLKYLDLSSNAKSKRLMQPVDFLFLKGCSQLESLKVSQCSQIPGPFLISLISNFPNLKELDMYGLTKVRDEHVIQIAYMCPNLTTLDVGGCKHLTDASFKAIGQYCPKMETLSIGDCNITNATLVHLSNCHLLKTLSIFMFPDTGETLEVLAAGCPQLENFRWNFCGDGTIIYSILVMFTSLKLQTLSLMGFPEEINEMLDSLTAPSLSLKKLTISYSNITDISVDSIVRRCPNLRWLDIQSTRISGTCIQDMVRNCALPMLTSIRVNHCNVPPQTMQLLKTQRGKQLDIQM